VTEDASLDAFAGSGDDADEADAVDEDEPIGSDAPDVAPAVSTYAWSPEGGACDGCGASVQRRWRDDGALVCADCKKW